MVRSLRTRLAELLPGTQERRAQTESWAASWEHRNEAVLADPPGLLWIALGDSTSQGIGAPSFDRGWVGQLLERLQRRERDWDVVNLSVTGARIRDVLDEQLPALAELPGSVLVTCAVGANDLLRARRSTAEADVERLLSALPPHAVVATIPRGVRERLAEPLSERIRSEAPARGLRVADVWRHTGPPWRGKYFADGFHPNEVGYREWTDAFAETLGLPG